MPPISLDAAWLAALRDLIKPEVAAGLTAAAPGPIPQAPTTGKEEDVLEIIK